MATSLTLYGSNVASTTLSTACKLATGTGGTETSTTTTAPNDSSQNYMEWLSQGGSGTDSASLPSPDGHGWLLDSSLLFNQTLAGGSWSCTFQADDTMNFTSITFILRAWKYASSGGSYTSIGSLTSTGNSMSGTKTSYSFPNTTLNSMDFKTNEYLYFDLFPHPTTGHWTADPMQIFLSNSATAGVANDLQISTPGYNLSMTFTDGLSAADSVLITQVDIPVESNTVSDVQLATDAAGLVENNTIVDSPLATDAAGLVDSAPAGDIGGLQGWNVDALIATDSILFVDGAIPVENNPVADVQLVGGAFSTVDGLSGNDSSNNTAQLLAIDALSANDSQLDTQSLQGIESLAAGDGVLFVGVYLIIELNSILDSPLFVDNAGLIDSAPAGDIGNLQAWGIDALLAGDGFSSIDTGLFTEQNTLADSSLDTAVSLFVDALVAGDTTNSTDSYVPVETLPLNESVLIGGSYSTVDGLAIVDAANTADSYQAVESVPISDAAIAQDGYSLIEALAVSEQTLFITAESVTEQLPLTEQIVYVDGWTILDGLATSDVAFAADSYSVTEQNTVADSSLDNAVFLPVESSLTLSDSMSATSTLAGIEGLTAFDILLVAFLANLTEANTAGDSFLPAAGYIPVDSSLLASDGIQLAGLFVPVEPLTALDILLALVSVSWTDSAPILDATVQNPTFAPVDSALSVADALQAVGLYLPVEALTVLESILARDSASWADSLSITDLFTLMQTVPQHILPVVLQALFRDGVLVATFRDGVTMGIERDGILIAEYR